MSQRNVYYLEVKSLTGEWISVGPAYSRCSPFLYESTVEEAKHHYESLGLEVRIEIDTMEFDDRS